MNENLRGDVRVAPSLEDVARLAGVSKITVSTVLNGTRSNTRVSPATRERILSVVEQIGYHPSAIARSLRQKRTNIIGYYGGYGFISVRSNFTSALLGGLQEGCEMHTKDLLLHGAFRGSSVEDIYSELASGKIDGLVMFAPDGDPLIDRLRRSHLPVVLVADGAPGVTSIVPDDIEGSRLIAEYLHLKKHRRVLYRCIDRYHAAVERRLAGFQEAAQRLGMTVTVRISPDHVLTEDERTILAPENPQRPTAIVGWCDDWAKGALADCLSFGWRVPNDLAIVGFDGVEPSDPPRRSLTTIRVPWHEVGMLAIEQLIRQMSGEKIPERTIVPVSLIMGDTA